jgi:hypothetical protein
VIPRPDPRIKVRIQQQTYVELNFLAANFALHAERIRLQPLSTAYLWRWEVKASFGIRAAERVGLGMITTEILGPEATETVNECNGGVTPFMLGESPKASGRRYTRPRSYESGR